MHEGDRAQRRFADRSAGDRDRGCIRKRYPPGRGQLHEQIVRMLPIDQRPPVERFAHLKDLAIPGFAGGQRIEAQHAGERQPPAAGATRGHPHPPVRRLELVAAARPSLVVEEAEYRAVPHQHPRRRRLIALMLVLMFLRRAGGGRCNQARRRHGNKSARHGSSWTVEHVAHA